MAKLTEGRRSNVLNCLAQLKVYTLSYSPHFLHPNNVLTLNDGESGNQESSEVSLDVRSSYPYQLQLPNDIPGHNVPVETNIVTGLVDRKKQFIDEATKVTANYHRTKSQPAAKTKNEIHSSHLHRLLELSLNDPDPYFFGPYNWYYTGGLLQSMSDNNLLFYVTGEKLNIFNSATLNVRNNKLNLTHLDSTITGDTIFEVLKSPNDCYVATRQKSQFTIFPLRCDDVQENIIFTDARVPYIGGAFIDSNFYSMNMNRTIVWNDLETKQVCGRMHLKKTKNNSFWCQLRTYNDQIVYADESKLKIYDNRLFGSKAAKCMELNIDSLTEKCEEITCIHSHMFEHNLYLGLTHNLFVIDVRYGTEGSNQLTRYTHQMKTPPLIMDAIGGGIAGATMNERLICTAGTMSDDIILTQHSKNRANKVQTNNIPQRVLSLSDIDSGMTEMGLQPDRKSINRNINAGACFMRFGAQLFLLSEKSSGEIFYQEITHELEDRPNIEKRYLQTNEQSHPTNDKIVATTVTNFDSLKRILTYKLHDGDSGHPTSKPNKWQKSAEQLGSYKDMLSADLLGVWSERLQPVPTNNKADKAELVNRWINKTSDFDALAENLSDK